MSDTPHTGEKTCTNLMPSGRRACDAIDLEECPCSCHRRASPVVTVILLVVLVIASLTAIVHVGIAIYGVFQ